MVTPISATQARSQFNKILDSVLKNKVRFLIKRYGKPVVAFITMDDFKKLQEYKKGVSVCNKMKRKVYQENVTVNL